MQVVMGGGDKITGVLLPQHHQAKENTLYGDYYRLLPCSLNWKMTMKFRIEYYHPSQEAMNAWLDEIIQGMQGEAITPESVAHVRQQLEERIFAATKINVVECV